MKKILFATDGSTCSHHAAKFLARLPHADKLEIDVLSIVNTPQLYTDGTQSQWFVDYVKDQHQQAEKDFLEVKLAFPDTDTQVNHEIKKGRIGATIVETAKEINADLIVMGARGRSEIERILLGSTSDYVATHAHCSVLVVRPSEMMEREIPLRFALAFEDAGPAQAAVEELADAKWAADATVHLVSVLPPLQGISGDFDPNVDAMATADRAMRRAASDMSDSCKRVRTQLVDHRHVGEGVVRFAEANRCDVVVVGESPRSSLGRMLLGSVSRYVLRHAPCSVLITRNKTIKAQGHYPVQSFQTT